MEVSCQIHALLTLALGKYPGTHRSEDWVGPRARLDVVEKKKSVAPVIRI
jgi:hypothetical protein